MLRYFLLYLALISLGHSATIAIIDTGFDLDHEFLRPKILKKETDEEAINFHGWDFFDNSHLKKSVIDDKSDLQEILLFRNLRAKGHKEGLSFDEFEWYKKKKIDKIFMEKVRLFKKHSHGTFVAGIALREGTNINIFPIRGLNIPHSVFAVEDNSSEGTQPLKGKTPEEKFQEEVENSLNRVTRKFSKICRFLSYKKIEVVNASYGITYKNLMTKFRELHMELVEKEIDEKNLTLLVDNYFQKLYVSSEMTMRNYSNILFIFSAGNSGLDNDLFHHYPSRIKVPNAITVAAMNGDYLASFSNYGQKNVDIGAPGVAILTLVPKVYSHNGNDIYSPASGTSMAAPYISNLAAQILNTNPKLAPAEIRRIILETGEEKPHLKSKLASGSMVSNTKALRAALLTKDMKLDEAINLGRSDLIPMEDQISFGLHPAISPEEMKKKVMESIPSIIHPEDLDEEPEVTPTKSKSSLQKDQEKAPQDNSRPLLLKPEAAPEKLSDQAPSNQKLEQSPPPSVEMPASSSQSELTPPKDQGP